MNKILISGSTLKVGLPVSLGSAFRSVGWVVDYFDDVEELMGIDTRLRNKFFYRIFWRLYCRTLEEKFLKKISEQRPNFVLIIKGFYYSPRIYKKIKKLFPDLKLLYFNPDNSFNDWHFGNSNRNILKSIPYFDLHLVWASFLIQKTYDRGAKRVELMQFAFDNSIFNFTNNKLHKDDEIDISFIGSWDKEREKIIESILDYKIKIWGNGWEKSNKIIRERWQGSDATGMDFKEICQNSKINLNLVRVQNVPSHNMRSFEIPGIGGFMLSTYCSELDLIFKDNRLMSFTSLKELKEKIDFFIDKPNERELLALNAKEVVEGKHTYLHRIKIITKIISEL